MSGAIFGLFRSTGVHVKFSVEIDLFIFCPESLLLMVKVRLAVNAVV